MKKHLPMSIRVLLLLGFVLPGLTHAQEVCEDGESDDCTAEKKTNNQETDIPPSVKAELDALRAQIEALKEHNDDREMAELEADAETAITREDDDDEKELQSKTFKGGERSLQALNPEISVVGDLFARFVSQGGALNSETARTGFFPRVLGIHFQSNLDPFSFAKMVVGVTPTQVVLGEMYVTWNAVTPWLSLTFGKFHQQFGVVNRWHAPGLDQFAYPLVLQEHFGDPLNQTGVAAVFLMPPMWADVLELEVQITNGQNAKLFSGNFFSIPSGLVHLRSYWDLNRDTYLEFGLSGLVGVNNAWGKPVQEDPVPAQLYDESGNEVTFYDADGNPLPMVTGPGATSVQNDDDWRLSVVGGADLTINWEPVNRAKYKGFTWRTEFLYAYKQVQDDTGGDAVITSFGAYSYMQHKPIRNWIFGVRGDVTQPFVLKNDGKFTWGVVPYITWWQSPWVRFRLEYDHIHWFEGEPEHRAMLQVTFSAGPHKLERY